MSGDFRHWAGPSAGPGAEPNLYRRLSAAESPPKESIREIRIKPKPFSFPPEFTIWSGRIENSQPAGPTSHTVPLTTTLPIIFEFAQTPTRGQKAPVSLNSSKQTFKRTHQPARTSFARSVQPESRRQRSIVMPYAGSNSLTAPRCLTAFKLFRAAAPEWSLARLSTDDNNNHTARYGFIRGDVSAGIGVFISLLGAIAIISSFKPRSS